MFYRTIENVKKSFLSEYYTVNPILREYSNGLMINEKIIVDKENEMLTIFQNKEYLDMFEGRVGGNSYNLSFEKYITDKIWKEYNDLISEIDESFWRLKKSDFDDFLEKIKVEVNYIVVQANEYWDEYSKENNTSESFENIISHIDTMLESVLTHLDSKYSVKTLEEPKNEDKVDKRELKVDDFFVSLSRIEEIKSINSTNFDLKKVVQISEELNIAWQNKAYFTVGILVRVFLDHIPPIFGFSDFVTFASGYTGGRTIKQIALSLQESSRKIADRILHSPISRVVTLPNEVQVNNRREIDVLLEEIVRVLK